MLLEFEKTEEDEECIADAEDQEDKRGLYGEFPVWGPEQAEQDEVWRWGHKQGMFYLTGC